MLTPNVLSKITVILERDIYTLYPQSIKYSQQGRALTALILHDTLTSSFL